MNLVAVYLDKIFSSYQCVLSAQTHVFCCPVIYHVTPHLVNLFNYTIGTLDLVRDTLQHCIEKPSEIKQLVEENIAFGRVNRKLGLDHSHLSGRYEINTMTGCYTKTTF